jgi:hypothetical protein
MTSLPARSSGPLTVGQAMMRHLHMSKAAVITATSHGQVSIGGECIAMKDLRTPISVYQGKILKLYQREYRLGSRIYEEHEQMNLGEA